MNAQESQAKLSEIKAISERGDPQALEMIMSLVESAPGGDFAQRELASNALHLASEAILTWGRSHPEQAERFALELARGSARPGHMPAMCAGLAYLACARVSPKGFPFNIHVHVEEDYDDEGGTVESHSPQATIVPAWSFPDPFLKRWAATVFDEMLHEHDWEGSEGSHSGSQFMDEEAKHWSLPMPTNASEARSVMAALDACLAKAAIEQATLGAHAKARGPKGL